MLDKQAFAIRVYRSGDYNEALERLKVLATIQDCFNHHREQFKNTTAIKTLDKLVYSRITELAKFKAASGDDNELRDILKLSEIHDLLSRNIEYFDENTLFLAEVIQLKMTLVGRGNRCPHGEHGSHQNCCVHGECCGREKDVFGH